MKTYEEKLYVLNRMFAAIPAGDIEAVKAIYHPEAAIWHNTDNLEQAVPDNLRTLGWVAANIRNLRYDDIRRTAMDSGQVVQEHVLRGVGPTGKQLNIVGTIVFTFDEDGRITRLEEYLDSAQVAALR